MPPRTFSGRNRARERKKGPRAKKVIAAEEKTFFARLFSPEGDEKGERWKFFPSATNLEKLQPGL